MKANDQLHAPPASTLSDRVPDAHSIGS